MNTSLPGKIEGLITQNLNPGTEIYMKDLTGEENHFEIFVVSTSFQDESRISRQRKVMDCVTSLWNEGLHALSIKTYTPSEWEKAQNEN